MPFFPAECVGFFLSKEQDCTSGLFWCGKPVHVPKEQPCDGEWAEFDGFHADPSSVKASQLTVYNGKGDFVPFL